MCEECPLVSVIIPSKNRFYFVQKTLESILAQTYQNIEIIVIDDGSDVLLAEIIENEFGSEVVVLRHEKSLGAPAARNTGAKYANGEYFAFLDDDDEWLPEKIEKQMSSFLELDDNFGVVYCGFDFLVNDEVIIKDSIYHAQFDLFRVALRVCPIGSPTPLIKKQFFNLVDGFDVSLPACQDWDLWIRLSQVCRFYPIKESLALYRIHGQQISVDIPKKIIARKKLLNKYLENLCEYPDILSSHYRRLGALSVLVGHHSDARSFFLKSIRQNFRNWGSWAHLFLEYLCKTLNRYLIVKYGTETVGNIRIVD